MSPASPWSPFKRRDIAKAFFDLDISDDDEPSRNKKPSVEPKRWFEGGGAKTVQTARLFTLPIEIRLQIYELLLVVDPKDFNNSSWIIGDDGRKQFHIDPDIKVPARHPALLRTCKTIHNEANPVLYSMNNFHFGEADKMSRYISQIGPRNLLLVRSLEISIGFDCPANPWVSILHTLAKDASGVRSLKVDLQADNDFPGLQTLPPGAKPQGLGLNLELVRALGEIQGLERMVLHGYYAKRWPAYLEEKMGVKVDARRGSDHSKQREGPNVPDIIRNMDKTVDRWFRQYQRGTAGLRP